MSSTINSFRDGARRGLEMAIDPERAWKKEQARIAAESSHSIRRAWENTGRHMRAAMDREKAFQADYAQTR